MALGKARSNKRSSNSSRSATVTTIVIASMCIMGLWLLSPSSVTAPKFAARITTVDSSSSSSVSREVNSKMPVFEDSEENLPNDAIKPDDRVDVSKENGVTNVKKDEEKESKREEQQKVEVESGKETQSQYHGKENEEQEVQESHGMTSKDQIEHDQIAHDEDGPKETDKESEVHHKMEIQEQTQQKIHEETNNDQIQEQTQQNKHENDKEPEGHHERTKIQEQTQQKIHGVTSKDQIQENTQQSRQDNDKKEAEGHQEKVKMQEQPQQKTQGKISKDQIQHDEAPVRENKDKDVNQREGDDEILHKHHRSGPKEKIPIPTTKKISSPPEGSLGMPTKLSDEKKEKHDVVKKEQNSSKNDHKWQLCNVTAGPDYIPCLDNEEAIAKLKSRSHYEHRERHCPKESPTCLVPLPKGYKKPVKWPQSRDKIWYDNVPSTELAKVKGHQNWMKVTGEFITFPGGGTQFIHGATHYIEFLQEAVPDISWGKHTRVILDVGCGVASFSGYLFKKDVVAMSFAPKDEHEAQVQFALERGIPAISAVMGTQRLPFPSKVFDLVHCARCRVPWHAGGGILLLEVDRVLRPGGFFVWSETPVYQTNKEDVKIWEEMSNLTMSMCWELITIQKDKLNSIGAAIYQKPSTNECYDKRKRNHPPMCKSEDDPNAAWYIPLQACIHRVPTGANERGTEWPEEWPDRLQTPPQWLNRTQKGFYGKPAREDFVADYENWKQVVNNLYRAEMGIDWSVIRNIMDMRAVYGGFAAALKDLEVWVMNVVNIDSPDTLSIIYERGLFGIHHDWCESFSTYPRTYDLLHADHLFSKLKKRCSIVPVLAEVDRIVRPEGNLIARDDSNTIREVETLLKSLHWGVNLTFSRNDEMILHAHKLNWRPDSYAASS